MRGEGRGVRVADTHAFLVFLHAGGHGGYRAADGRVVRQVGQLLAQVDGHGARGVERARPERQLRHGEAGGGGGVAASEGAVPGVGRLGGATSARPAAQRRRHPERGPERRQHQHHASGVAARATEPPF